MKNRFDLANYLNKVSQPANPQVSHTEQIVLINVNDLEPNPKNFYKISDIESLAAMIEIQGKVITPLEVKKVENGKYIAIAGHRRRAAVLLLLERGANVSPLLPAYIRNYDNSKDELTAMVQSNESVDWESVDLILSNRGQRQRDAEEIAEEIKRLQPFARAIFEEEKAKGNVQGRFRKFFAEQILGISESSLQRATQVAKLPDAVKAELGKGLTATAASELSGLTPEEQIRVISNVKNQDKPMTVKSIQTEKRQTVSPAVKPKAEKRNQPQKEQAESAPTAQSDCPDQLEQYDPPDPLPDPVTVDFHSLKKLQEQLLDYKKILLHEFTQLILKIQDNLENQTYIAADFTKLEHQLAAVTADIARLKQR